MPKTSKGQDTQLTIVVSCSDAACPNNAYGEEARDVVVLVEKVIPVLQSRRILDEGQVLNELGPGKAADYANSPIRNE